MKMHSGCSEWYDVSVVDKELNKSVAEEINEFG